MAFEPPAAFECKVIITVMIVIRFLIFITDGHSRSLVNVSVQICTGALSADKTPASLSFAFSCPPLWKERRTNVPEKNSRRLRGGTRRWDWEERKGTGVWNLVEKAGARKRDTQSVCHCNGGRFDTQVSAVPVSSGRSFHYQSAPISRPHSILAIQEPGCPSALSWALIGWEVAPDAARLVVGEGKAKCSCSPSLCLRWHSFKWNHKQWGCKQRCIEGKKETEGKPSVYTEICWRTLGISALGVDSAHSCCLFFNIRSV